MGNFVEFIFSAILVSGQWIQPFHDTKPLSGKDLSVILENHQYTYYIEKDDGRFADARNNKIEPSKTYNVQMSLNSDLIDSNNGYYSYQMAQDFLNQKTNNWKNLGYQTNLIGQSYNGRDLNVVFPHKFDPNKKLVVMFGRQHGDESSHNYIIEGFVDGVLQSKEFHKKFQLVLYPMINPDGAEAKRRHNMQGFDLNRSWDPKSRYSQEPPEVAAIHKHLDAVLAAHGSDPVVVWDMHGSFTEDFIFRVDNNYISQAYHDHQSTVIDTLGQLDPWQAGNYRTSNGHPNMARIVMGKNYGFNALTHETPRDLRNLQDRGIHGLKRQGVAILDTIMRLY